MKRLLLFIVIGLKIFSLKAQENTDGKEYQRISIACYSSSVISASYNFSYEFYSELKTFSNSKLEDVSIEIDLMYSFKAREYHHFNMGVGLKLDPFTEGGDGAAITVPFQLEIYPFKQNKRISAIIELAPEIYFEDDVMLRNLIGIRYSVF